MKGGIILQTLKRIHQILTPSQRKGALGLLLGILGSSILDVLGLAAILPVLTVALKPEMIRESEILLSVYERFGFASDDQFLLFLVLVMFGMFLVKNLVGALIIYFQAHFSTGISTHLSRQAYRIYMQKGYQVIKDIDSGNYITNVRNISTFFAQSVLIPMATFLSEFVVVMVIIVGIAAYNFQLIMVLGIVMGAGFFLIYRTTRKMAYQIGEERKVLAPKLISLLNETIRGYIDIHIFNSSQFFLKDFVKHKIRENQLVKWQSFLGLIPAKINEVIAILGIVIVFLYGLFFAENRGELLILLSLFAAAAYRVMPSMNRMLAALVSVRSHLYTLDILEEMGQGPSTETEPAAQPISFEKEIGFQSLEFSFADSQTPVLQDIHFTVKKGEQIGLVGTSGSGKTTLMRILLRLFKQGSGSISIDGVPLGPENEVAWIEKIGYVQQNVFIRDATILENVAFGQPVEEADQEKARRALEMASLGDFLDQLPEGLHTPMGEFGSKLSGGQRQRVAIARALYVDAEVFVFDEATSALDPETEFMITESIDSLAKNGKTIFLIAHRFTTLQGCDRIFELDKGKIVREYQYDELLKEKLGLIQEST